MVYIGAIYWQFFPFLRRTVRSVETLNFVLLLFCLSISQLKWYLKVERMIVVSLQKLWISIKFTKNNLRFGACNISVVISCQRNYRCLFFVFLNPKYHILKVHAKGGKSLVRSCRTQGSVLGKVIVFSSQLHSNTSSFGINLCNGAYVQCSCCLLKIWITILGIFCLVHVLAFRQP